MYGEGFSRKITIKNILSRFLLKLFYFVFDDQSYKTNKIT